MLYLYLASNRNNYELALSPAAIDNAIGMAKSTYYDQFNNLVDKGYLVNTHGKTYEFFERPQSDRRSRTLSGNPTDGTGCPEHGKTVPNPGKPIPPKDIEINNRDNPTDFINNNNFSPAESEEVFVF